MSRVHALRSPTRRAAALALLVAVALAAVLGAGPADSRARIEKPRWIGGVTLSEYWPVPERWFRGELVTLPGIAGKHRVDWAYSGTGMLMEGDGVGLDGRRYHVDDFGRERWVNAAGQPTKPTRSGNWTHGDPAWRDGGWRNAQGAVTFPLDGGGWSNGPAGGYTPLPSVHFASGPSLPLTYYRSVAVDPRLIAPGSRIYIPAYHRWFVAADTGSGIIGRHIDVYRPAPNRPDGGRFLQRARIYVVPPRR
jgi:3D (Asp-Asp-Asp) domain-containing protein